MAPAMGAPRLSTPFLPLSDGAFAGYHLDLARTFMIEFAAGEDGRVSALTVPAGDNVIKAVRRD